MGSPFSLVLPLCPKLCPLSRSKAARTASSLVQSGAVSFSSANHSLVLLVCGRSSHPLMHPSRTRFPCIQISPGSTGFKDVSKGAKVVYELLVRT